MNNPQAWINDVKYHVNGKNFWQFTLHDASKKQIIVQWHMADIISPILAAFKKEVADLAAQTTASSEVEFLRQYPEAVNQEIFLKSCAPFFAQGVDKVDWKAVKTNIETTIKQFYCTDIAVFGEQAIKALSHDVYFFASARKEETCDLLGFCMFAITPQLPYGDIKLINISLEASLDQSLGKQLLALLFAIIKPQRIFTAIRPTNKQAQDLFASCGFTIDSNPQQDPNHALKLTYFTCMEYEADVTNDLQTIAKTLY